MPVEWRRGEDPSPERVEGQRGAPESAASRRPLLDERSLLHAGLDSLPMALAIVSVPDFVVLLANQVFTAGIEAGPEAVGRRLVDLIPCHVVPFPAVADVLRYLEVAATGEPVTVTDQEARLAGRGTVHYRFSLNPLRDAAGRVAAVAVVAQDTTEQVEARLQAEHLAERLKAANDELTLANLRLEAIISRLPQGVIAIDRAGRIMVANGASERLLGSVLPVGERLYDLAVTRLKPGGAPYAVAELPLSRSLEGETCYGVEITVRQANGQEVHTLCSSAPLHDAAGQVVGAVSIFQDITELRAVDRLKDEFLSIASHELKNPLTVLKGYVQLLLRDGERLTGERGAQMLGVIDREVNRLGGLINAMLDVSRIELGGLVLSRQPMELVALARKLLDHLQGVVQGHRLSLVSEVERVEGAWDPVRIEQVLANLIDNAVKYSPKGGTVTVLVRRVPEGVEVAVRDEGVGIPPEQQSQVFEKFFRANSRVSEYVAGLGLGLYVCNEIVRAHGGRMWLESQPMVGSTFHFVLPLSG